MISRYQPQLPTLRDLQDSPPEELNQMLSASLLGQAYALVRQDQALQSAQHQIQRIPRLEQSLKTAQSQLSAEQSAHKQTQVRFSQSEQTAQSQEKALTDQLQATQQSLAQTQQQERQTAAELTTAQTEQRTALKNARRTERTLQLQLNRLKSQRLGLSGIAAALICGLGILGWNYQQDSAKLVTLRDNCLIIIQSYEAQAATIQALQRQTQEWQQKFAALHPPTAPPPASSRSARRRKSSSAPTH